VYQHASLRPEATHSGDLLTVRLRYKQPTGSTSRLLSSTIADRSSAHASDDMRFASAVAAFAMLLRDSDNKGSVTFDQVLDMARGARGADAEGYRGEFVGLVEAARTLRAAQPPEGDPR
jgi:Ca-activated chloride channel family protein